MNEENFKKREKEFLKSFSPCDTNLHSNGPRTITDAKKIGRQMCPNFQKCNSGELNSRTGFACTMLYASQIAEVTVKEYTTVSREIQGAFGEFFRELDPPKGFIWAEQHNGPIVFISNKEEALVKIKEFALQLVSGS